MALTPWTFTLDANDLADGHHELTLTVPPSEDLADGWTLGQIIDAYRWVAGIVARVGLVLLPEVTVAGHEHGCRTKPNGYGIVEGCHVSGAVAALADPAYDTCDPPGVWIIIPSRQRKAWRERVTAVLDQIVSADRVDHGLEVAS